VIDLKIQDSRTDRGAQGSRAVRGGGTARGSRTVRSSRTVRGSRTARPKAAPRLSFAKPGKKERAPRPRLSLKNNPSLRTALWLLVPPVGLTLMWRRSCRWHPAVKACVSVAMAAILVAVLVIPTSVAPVDGGVQLVTSRPEVEVYGPDLPSFIVPGYTNEQTDSVIVSAEKSDVHYVYAADGARCYHEYKCKFAFASSQRLTVFEAYYLGFEPCNRCKPPIYDPVSGTTTEQEHPDDYDPS